MAFYFISLSFAAQNETLTFNSGGMTDALLTLLSRLMECVWKQYHRGRCVHLFYFFFLQASRQPDSLIPPKGHIIINVTGWKSEMGREVSIAKVLTAHQMEFFPNPLDLFHVSVWDAAHRKHIKRGTLFMQIINVGYLCVTSDSSYYLWFCVLGKETVWTVASQSYNAFKQMKWKRLID